MSRDAIRERPAISWAILAVGAVAYLFICIPSIRQRGYPEIDPFWDALPFLWLAPIPLAEIFSSGLRRRFPMLISYAMVTAFVDAGAIVDIVPHHLSLMSMCFMMVFTGPLHLAGTFLSAAFWQFVLRTVRVLTDDGGQPISTIPVRTFLYAIAVVALSVSFPFFFRHATYSRAVARGQAKADADWSTGKAVWYVHRSESEFFHGCFARGTLSLETGLPLEAMRGGPVRERYYRSYREAIRDRLARFGRPKVMDQLLNPSEIQSLIDGHLFRKVTSYPIRHGALSFTSPRTYTIGDKQDSLRGTDYVYMLVLTNKQNTLLVVTDNDVLTFSASGQLLQQFDCYEDKIDASESRLTTRSEGMQQKPNQVPEDTARKLADPQH